MKTTLIFCGLISLLLVTGFGCSEPASPGDYSNQLVLNAYLFAGKAIDSVYVQRTAQILERYTEEAVALTGASVTISLMKAADPSSAETTYVLLGDPARPGRYSSPAIILPRRTYSITVTAGGYPVVTGMTTVPDTFHITTTLPSTLTWEVPSSPIILSWSPSNGYSDYVVSLTSTDLNAQYVDDFRSRNRNPDDPKPERTAYFFNIPNLNTVELPWIFFHYLGRHTMSVSAVDENYYDFIRQSMNAQNGSLREIRYRLNGGLGVFASAAIASNQIHITLVQ